MPIDLFANRSLLLPGLNDRGEDVAICAPKTKKKLCMANKNNSNDYKKIVESVDLGPMSRRNLVIPDHEETLEEALKEGFRLLRE